MARRSARGGRFPRAAVVEAEALAVHFQDMDMMGEAVEQRPGEALRAERFGNYSPMLSTARPARAI